MLKQPDKADFIQVIVKEIDARERRSHWELCRRADFPKRMKTIMFTWAFKWKRLPSGELLKHKARICAHGGQQQWGIKYWETYAHVANWTLVGLLLALSHIHGLESRSICFVLAFPQVVLETEVHVEMPQGFDRCYDSKSYLLKIKRLTHGPNQSNYTFYRKFSTALKSRKMLSCSTDKKVWIDIFVQSLFDGKEKFELTDEGNIDKHLGVEIDKRHDGSY